MKYAKSAAVAVGSVMALGTAVPAFAAQPGAPTMSLNGGLTDALHSKQLDGHQIAPLVKMVKTTKDKVKSTSAKKLLGSVAGATKKAPLLGGLPLGK
ncbi:hypothetical protein SLV14_003466 [Streptomyces sp. Je 1-4]|uniref:hypothetical protein n=1 Tax=Streptomyces TaxID=1883 RepID=UPI00140EDF21|nr:MULTISPECIES: hypothetical protein [unclassified Streptomyces]QIK07336.1 hypothetical protein G7Z12_16090 [Streptomyces sp. ID38640]UYB40797.1 hypothetical protein SLV14_003466 [Streptomyces sp. Je 1-4]UZQ36949.1 hypothetical protein SLV14N_003466 [Streptomyces sp. Je 1-4] [Streptomyces sp. Je 1-4 4N24]UZQ44366.1 hypothetical protein SLV14NA_003466 [Streptomyces sp. Je 1-4] [Streptomyces sp. Je 1-4 4N24_ara]